MENVTAPSASVSADIATNDGTNGPDSSASTVAETPREKALKKFQIKVDGKLEDFEVDLNDEEGLKRHFQMSKAASKRMEEASSTRRQAEDFIKRLQTDPVSVLQDPRIGVNFREMAESYLAKQIEEEMLSPQEKKIRDAERILKEREDSERTSKEKAESERFAKLQAQYASDYDKKIGDALKGANLPKTPKTVHRMASLMAKNLEMGLELEPKDLVELVRTDYVREFQEMFGAADDDSLLAIMGDGVANKIRKADLKRLRTVAPSAGFAQNTPSRTGAREPQKMSKDEWRERLERIKSGK